jgi:DNA-binding XRE family transcriptional regulator
MSQAKSFPFRAQDRRWSSPLGRFVDFFGADRLAARVEVQPSAVYHWLGGRAQPRPAIAMKIRRLASSSGFSISFDDIYQNFRESRVELCPLDSITETSTRTTRMRRANRSTSNSKKSEDK